MNKRYLLLLGGVVVLLIVFALILVFQQEPQTPRQKVIVVSPNGKTTAQAVPTIVLPPLGKTAKEATLQFYTYYTSSPQNPFANGAYKTNPYLAPEFKTVVAAGNGNLPVFCTQNIRKNVVVDKESTYYYDNGYLTSEVIGEGPSGAKDLFKVTLKNVNGKWFIFDINCVT